MSTPPINQLLALQERVDFVHDFKNDFRMVRDLEEPLRRQVPARNTPASAGQ